jgi:hypothetical protein
MLSQLLADVHCEVGDVDVVVVVVVYRAKLVREASRKEKRERAYCCG